MSLHIVKGDITGFQGECVVNAANESLCAGGGVCGAIHRAAGVKLESFCKNLAPCPTGSCVITPAFAMDCRDVIHAVGPVWQGGGRGEEDILHKTYQGIFSMVRDKGIKSLALPAISTGIFGFSRLGQAGGGSPTLHGMQ